MIDQQKCIDAIDSLKAIQPYLIHAKRQKRVRKLIQYLEMELRCTQTANRACSSIEDLTMG